MPTFVSNLPGNGACRDALCRHTSSAASKRRKHCHGLKRPTWNFHTLSCPSSSEMPVSGIANSPARLRR